jgi:hemerythrin
MAPTWNKTLATDVEEIDNQHKELFSRINKLFDACGQGKAKEEVSKIFEFLNDYVVVHFGAEEKYMAAYNYPGYAAHKAQHEEFIKGFNELKSKFTAEGKGLYVTISTNRLLSDWLINHIHKVDKALASFLKSKL